MTSPGDTARAVEMWLAGADPRSIATAAGFASAEEVTSAVRVALRARGDLPGQVDAAVTELARLDALMLGLWPRARRGESAALDAVLKISDRRMRILSDVQVAASASAMTEEMTTPLDELNRRRAARGAKTKGEGVSKVAGQRRP